MGRGIKAQTSTEFVLFISVIFLVMLLLISATIYYVKQYSKEKELAVIQREADMVKNEVYLASTVDEGYVRTFQIDPDPDEPSFNMTQQNNTVIFRSEHYEYAADLGVKINGTLRIGNNTIRNINGAVYVN